MKKNFNIRTFCFNVKGYYAAAALAVILMISGIGLSQIDHPHTAISAENIFGLPPAGEAIEQGYPFGVAEAMTAILYDQTSGSSGQRTDSTDFSRISFPTFNLDREVADDFVVPSGSVWNISQVNVVGGWYINDPTFPVGLNVRFYTNSFQNLPGNVACSPDGTVISGASTGSFNIQLSNICSLPTGKYWMSVQVVGRTNSSNNVSREWGWNDRIQQSNSPAAFIQRNGTQTCQQGWHVKMTSNCWGTAPPDNIFQLLGTSNSSATPTNTPTRTATSTPTRTPTGIPTISPTPTYTPTRTLTSTPTRTATNTPTNTPTASPSPHMPPASPLAYPATNITRYSFTANWRMTGGSDGYLLDVSTNASFTAFVPGYNSLNVGNGPEMLLSWDVTGLNPNTIYYYRVRGYNYLGIGSNSNGVSVQTTANTPTSTPTATPPICVPPLANMVSLWRAQGSAADYVGNNSGTLANGTTFTPGKIGQAFSFDGVDDYVWVSDSPSLSPSSRLTIEAWVNLSTYKSGGSIIVAKDQSTSGFRDYLFQVVGSQLELVVFFDNGTRVQVRTGYLDLNTWHHVAGTYDGSTAKIYIDGTLVGSEVGSGRINNSTTPFRIGSTNSSGQPRFFAGRIDDLSFYTRGLSAAEILSIYNAGSAGKCVTAGLTDDGGIDETSELPEINGRLLNSMGQGIPNVQVTLTDTTGRNFFAVTNGFGFYRFGELVLGQTYMISGESENYSFMPLTVSVTGPSIDVDMVADQ